MKFNVYMSAGHGNGFSEDRILIFDTILSKGQYSVSYSSLQEGCVAIFDGVGGLNGGAEAASYAAEQMHWYGDTYDTAKLQAYVQQIGINLFQSHGGATTATGLYFVNGRVLLFHVGNTRLYAMTEEFLERITDDQTTLTETYNGLPITQELKIAHGSEITGCLGGTSESLSRRAWAKDITGLFSGVKKLALTCDGIHDYVDITDIEKAAKADISPESLIEKARISGSEDDCSILILDMDQN